MTYIDEAEIRRPSRGTKVLVFGFGILAILGSFWGIVWFIRSYVEPPRVMRPSPLALASRDSVPVAPPAYAPAKRSEAAFDKTTTASAVAVDSAERAIATGAIADRWAPLTQSAPATAPVTAPPPAFAASAPAAADSAPAPMMPAAPT